MKSEFIKVGEFEIEVIRKEIKSMRIAVYPPDGRVTLAVPTNTEIGIARIFAELRLRWIKNRVEIFKAQARETPRENLAMESHYLFGVRRLLSFKRITTGANCVKTKGIDKIEICTKDEPTPDLTAKLLKEFYKKELKKMIYEVYGELENATGVSITGFDIRQMKTMWAVSNTDKRTITINFEMVKKRRELLKFVILSQMVNFLPNHTTQSHDDLLRSFARDFEHRRKELNDSALTGR